MSSSSTPDPKLVEKVARAIHLSDEPEGHVLSISWDGLLEGSRDRYLAYARAAITALSQEGSGSLIGEPDRPASLAQKPTDNYDSEGIRPIPSQLCERLRGLLEGIRDQAAMANNTIRLNRDGSGNGRVKVATCMHHVERLSLEALGVLEAPKSGEAPWSDCKVAFGVEDDEAVWNADLSLPAGWELNETDCSGARCVAVFRVDGVPNIADGEAVAAMLEALPPAVDSQ